MKFVKMTDFEMEQLNAHLDQEEPISGAIQRHFIRPTEHGARVQTLTNDDNDDGYPDGNWQAWSLDYPSVEAALRHCGKCRVGVSGVIVTVVLEGKEVR